MNEVAVPHVLLLGSHTAGMRIRDGLQNQSPCSLVTFLKEQGHLAAVKGSCVAGSGPVKASDGLYVPNTS